MAGGKAGRKERDRKKFWESFCSIGGMVPGNNPVSKAGLQTCAKSTAADKGCIKKDTVSYLAVVTFGILSLV